MGCFIPGEITKRFEEDIDRCRKDVVGLQNQHERPGYTGLAQEAQTNLAKIIAKHEKNLTDAQNLEKQILVAFVEHAELAMELELRVNKNDWSEKVGKRYQNIRYLADLSHLEAGKAKTPGYNFEGGVGSGKEFERTGFEDVVERQTKINKVLDSVVKAVKNSQDFKSLDKMLKKFAATDVEVRDNMQNLRSALKKCLKEQAALKKHTEGHKAEVKRWRDEHDHLREVEQPEVAQKEAETNERCLADRHNREKLANINSHLKEKLDELGEEIEDYKGYVDEFMTPVGNMTTQHHGGPAPVEIQA